MKRKLLGAGARYSARPSILQDFDLNQVLGFNSLLDLLVAVLGDGPTVPSAAGCAASSPEITLTTRDSSMSADIATPSVSVNLPFSILVNRGVSSSLFSSASSCFEEASFDDGTVGSELVAFRRVRAAGGASATLRRTEGRASPELPLSVAGAVGSSSALFLPLVATRAATEINPLHANEIGA